MTISSPSTTSTPGVPVLVQTKDGDDEIYVGSTATAVRNMDGSVTRSSDNGTVNTIRDTLTIEMGSGSNDYLEIDETGENPGTASVVELTGHDHYRFGDANRCRAGCHRPLRPSRIAVHQSR